MMNLFFGHAEDAGLYLLVFLAVGVLVMRLGTAGTVGNEFGSLGSVGHGPRRPGHRPAARVAAVINRVAAAHGRA